MLTDFQIKMLKDLYAVTADESMKAEIAKRLADDQIAKGLSNAKIGDRVDTKRRKAMVVLSNPDKSGWLQVRTLRGSVISISKADITRVDSES